MLAVPQLVMPLPRAEHCLSLVAEGRQREGEVVDAPALDGGAGLRTIDDPVGVEAVVLCIEEAP